MLIKIKKIVNFSFHVHGRYVVFLTAFRSSYTDLAGFRHVPTHPLPSSDVMVHVLVSAYVFEASRIISVREISLFLSFVVEFSALPASEQFWTICFLRANKSRKHRSHATIQLTCPLAVGKCGCAATLISFDLSKAANVRVHSSVDFLRQKHVFSQYQHKNITTVQPRSIRH
jgi:hypothetical protein